MKTSKSIFILSFFIPISLLLGDIINVPADTSTIQGGIFLADTGDTVLVSEGTYYENLNFKGKAITVGSRYIMDEDTSHISKTVINGSQHTNPDSGSVVYFISGEDTTSVLSGFTITGGNGTDFVGFNRYGGGGICMSAGGKILHNKIIGNTMVRQKQSYGAGLVFVLLNANANLIISHNEFKYNSIVSPHMSGGGGIYLRPFSNNGHMRVNNNIISYNSATCTGTYKAIAGGIGISLDLPTLETVVVENNEITNNELHCKASMGSGLYVVYWEPGGQITDLVPTPIIRNNVIAHNYSQDRGAGIGIWTVEKNHQASSVITPQPAIINNTIVNNKANDGSGIFNFDSYPLLMNNIFWNDLSVEESREIFNDDIFYPDYTEGNGGKLHFYYTDIQGGWEGEGNIDANPDFADSLFNLSDTSYCVGNGIDSVEVGSNWYKCPSLDYYGHPRPHMGDGLVDMGAIESFFPQVPLNISQKDLLIPNKFELNQNYPNPFNPSTTIEFSLPKSEIVELKVFNILGKEVSTLVSRKLNQGNHTYTFEGKNLASGVYYYQLVAGEYMEVKKMILLR